MTALDFFGVPLVVGDYVFRALSIGQSAKTIQLCRVVELGSWKDDGVATPGVWLAYNTSYSGVRITGLIKNADRLVRYPENLVPFVQRFEYEN